MFSLCLDIRVCHSNKTKEVYAVSLFDSINKAFNFKQDENFEITSLIHGVTYEHILRELSGMDQDISYFNISILYVIKNSGDWNFYPPENTPGLSLTVKSFDVLGLTVETPLLIKMNPDQYQTNIISSFFTFQIHNTTKIDFLLNPGQDFTFRFVVASINNLKRATISKNAPIQPSIIKLTKNK